MNTTLELPPLPAAHSRALNLLSDADIDASALAQVVETDPSLTAAILRAANSAFSAPVNPIDTANAAVIRIGLTDTRRVIVGAVASSAFGQIEAAEIDGDETWKHLVAVALLTQAAMWRAGTPGGAVSQAFTAGMLHDIGRLSMAAQDPSRYSIVATLARSGADIREAGMRMFGFDHADWGGQVSEAWNVPDSVVDAIRNHHGADGDELAVAVSAARRITWSLGIGDGVTEAREATFPDEPLHEEIMSELGGIEGFNEQMDWYRGAMNPSGQPAAA
jgi:putative nucleotidyltransferase with HDIG domain